MYSSIAPCLSNSAKILSKSAKTFAPEKLEAVFANKPSNTLPLDFTAANKP